MAVIGVWIWPHVKIQWTCIIQLPQYQFKKSEQSNPTLCLLVVESKRSVRCVAGTTGGCTLHQHHTTYAISLSSDISSTFLSIEVRRVAGGRGWRSVNIHININHHRIITRMCWLIIASKGRGRGSRRRGGRRQMTGDVLWYYSWYVPDTRTPTRYWAGLSLHTP